jgi:peptidoglycan/xylan/chitin deacetylase (PgdA/CDA1 family)
MLTWEDVIDMRGHGVSFGSHTASHPILSRLSRQETVAEIERSCAAMERHLGERPGLFAYPNGTKADFTDMTKDVLKASGFRCAVTTEFGVNEPGADRFELKRGRPWEEHLPTFAFKLSWYRLMSSHAA